MTSHVSTIDFFAAAVTSALFAMTSRPYDWMTSQTTNWSYGNAAPRGRGPEGRRVGPCLVLIGCCVFVVERKKPCFLAFFLWPLGLRSYAEDRAGFCGQKKNKMKLW